MATTLLLDHEAEDIDVLRARAEALMPIPSDPSYAIWEAADGTLRTLPDITDHTALSAVTAAQAWADDDLGDPNSRQYLRDALV